MLTQKAKYGLKALLMLAERPFGQLVLVAEIADRENVPRKYLELILLELRKNGLLHSQRGRNGGYGLAKPPEEITFGRVIRVLDGPLAPFPCASINAYRKCDDCRDEVTCGVRIQMRRVRDAIADVLDNVTIAEAVAAAAAISALEVEDHSHEQHGLGI